jgi:rSAM/selenodomain-associated transferase 1
VFGRQPIPGRVKTRLIPALGAEEAARVYAWLLSHAVSCAQMSRFDARYLYVTQAAELAYFEARLRDPQWRFAVQADGDLGRRMHAAFDEVLGRHAFAILIGTDICDLNVSDLDAAYRRLFEGKHAVVGPSADGGYWLLGLTGVVPGLFTDIEWSTDQVFTRTREVLNANRLDWSVLPIRHDVDRVEDLALLPPESGGHTSS